MEPRAVPSARQKGRRQELQRRRWDTHDPERDGHVHPNAVLVGGNVEAQEAEEGARADDASSDDDDNEEEVMDESWKEQTAWKPRLEAAVGTARAALSKAVEEWRRQDRRMRRAAAAAEGTTDGCATKRIAAQAARRGEAQRPAAEREREALESMRQAESRERGAAAASSERRGGGAGDATQSADACRGGACWRDSLHRRACRARALRDVGRAAHEQREASRHGHRGGEQQRHERCHNVYRFWLRAARDDEQAIEAGDVIDDFAPFAAGWAEMSGSTKYGRAEVAMEVRRMQGGEREADDASERHEVDSERRRAMAR